MKKVNEQDIPRSLRERREAIVNKRDSELTAATAVSSCDSWTTTERHSSRDSGAYNGIHSNQTFYRQASMSEQSYNLTAPPRLDRVSSSESTGSAARKRSIGGRSRVLTDEGETQQNTCYFDDCCDAEMIRQQHEIMEQIRLEQEEFNRVQAREQDSKFKALTPGKEEQNSQLWSPMSVSATSTRSSPLSSPLTRSVTPREEEGNILDMFRDDPSMLQEQERIMEEIQRQRQNRPVTSTKPAPQKLYDSSRTFGTTASTSTTISSQSTYDPIAGRSTDSFTSSSVARRPPPESQLAVVKQPPSGRRTTIRNTLSEKQDDDAYVQYSGEKQSLRIKGTRHTWKAIEQGNATLVQCPSCSTVLQVSRTAKLVFCTKCQEVSPIILFDGKSMSDDLRIAQVLQLQEHEVAIARKIEKGAGR